MKNEFDLNLFKERFYRSRQSKNKRLVSLVETILSGKELPKDVTKDEYRYILMLKQISSKSKIKQTITKAPVIEKKEEIKVEKKTEPELIKEEIKVEKKNEVKIEKKEETKKQEKKEESKEKKKDYDTSDKEKK
jgi:hypothetical protein